VWVLHGNGEWLPWLSKWSEWDLEGPSCHGYIIHPYINPPYPQVLHLQVPPTLDQKYLWENCVCTKHDGNLFLLVIPSKIQYRIYLHGVYIVFSNSVEMIWSAYVLCKYCTIFYKGLECMWIWYPRDYGANPLWVLRWLYCICFWCRKSHDSDLSGLAVLSSTA
jgi:hypothetical protein